MYTFARYRVGETFGPCDITLGPELLAQWDATFPDAASQNEAIPPGLLSVITMRAYGSLIAPRPPGNIHAGLGFDVTRLPSRGETISLRFACAEKAIRRDRKFVDLIFECRDGDGVALFSGRFTSIVAQ